MTNTLKELCTIPVSERSGWASKLIGDWVRGIEAKSLLEGKNVSVEVARETGTKLALWIDGKVVEMTADEWKAYDNAITP